MKKLLIIAVAFQVSFAMASYTNFVGQGGDPTVGYLTDTANWPGSALPFGSVTGVIENAMNVWADVTQDFAVRLEGGRIYTSDLVAGDFAMRGGSIPARTTVVEIDTTDWSSGATNLAVGQLTMWSQFGGKMELSILNGRVEANTLNLVSGGNGTISMGNGEFHANSAVNIDLNMSMLSGGTGAIVWDEIKVGVASLYLDFASDNLGSFTIGKSWDPVGGTNITSSGVFEWMMANNRLSIDGVVDTNASSYNITYDGWSGKLRLPGALDAGEKYVAWVESFGLSATNESGSITNDFDLDGLENLTEYALGGNPVIPDADSINPTISTMAGTNTLAYVYNRRFDADARKLTYGLTVTTDALTSATWSPIGTALETGSDPIDAFFESVTNTIPTSTPIGFVNLLVTENF